MTTTVPRFTRSDAAVMAALCVVTVAAVGWSAQSLGFTRDEGYYFKAAESYWGWFRALFGGIADGHPTAALQPATIDKYWGYNHEHPALEKTLFAFGFGARELLGLDVAVHNAIRFPAWSLETMW